jgi:hypothetical protein
MKIVSIVIGLALVGVLAYLFFLNAESEADIGNPKEYQGEKISFRYPGNWAISDDLNQDGTRMVSVDSPGEATLMITIVDKKKAFSIKEYSNIVTASLSENSPDEKGDFAFGPVTRDGRFKALTATWTMTFLGESIPHTIFFRRRRYGKKVCFIMAQVADEDLAKVEPGFKQVFDTFKMK